MSKETISRITDKVIEETNDWSARPLDEIYAAVFIDAIVVKIRDGQVANRRNFAAIGVTLEGEKEILGQCLIEGRDRWRRREVLDGRAHRHS